MLLKENSLSGTIRGQSVASKKYYTSGLRSIAPKFLRDIGDKNVELKKNVYDSGITILTKQNIKPQIVSIDSTKQNRTFSKLSLAQKLKPIPIQIMPRGLHNIGNTCYMNSTLQCLLHLRSFPSALNTEMLNRLSGQLTIPPVANQLFLMMKEMASKGSALNLGTLKKAIGRKKPIFLGNGQQDSQQYLTNLLQILNQQLSRITKKCTYKELQGDPQKKPLTQLSNQWWDYYQQIDNSIVCDVFQGQTISSIKCRKCEKVSVNFDNIWGIPITFHRNKTVYDLLVNGWKLETLVEDFYCSGCKKTRDCTKLVQMFRLPKVLVVQLKRFQFENGYKRKRKQQTKIDTEIDISKLVNQSAAKTQETRYKLKGVVHHQGQAEYGHYYAEVYCDAYGKWYNLNDSNTDQTIFNPASKSAYLLFYEQCS